MQHSVSHISPRPTPHSTSLPLRTLHSTSLSLRTLHSTSLPLRTLHIPLHFNSLSFTAISWSSPHFTSLHLSLSNSFSWKSLHFTSLNTSLTFSLSILDFLALQNSFTSLHFTFYISAPFPGNTLFPPHFEFPSLHFTSLITFLTRFLTSLALQWDSPLVHTCPIPASHGLVISEWTWLTVCPPPSNPLIYLVQYSINRRVKGPHCLPRPPTAHQSCPPWVWHSVRRHEFLRCCIDRVVPELSAHLFH